MKKEDYNKYKNSRISQEDIINAGKIQYPNLTDKKYEEKGFDWKLFDELKLDISKLTVSINKIRMNVIQSKMDNNEKIGAVRSTYAFTIDTILQPFTIEQKKLIMESVLNRLVNTAKITDGLKKK
jgi:hypothetical protein